MNKNRWLFIGLFIGLFSCADNTKINFVDVLETPPDLPTPLISQAVEQSKTGTNEKITVQFKTGVIKGDGSITPVARQEFIIRKYDFHKFHNAYLLSRNIANKPNFATDIKYRTNIDNPNVELQFKNVLALFETNLKTWYDEVYSDFKNQLSKYSKSKSIIVKSDLSGEFTADLENNTTYYITGKYQDNFNIIYWNSFEFKTGSNKKIELSNDNGILQDVKNESSKSTLNQLEYDKLLQEIMDSVKDF